MDNPAHSDGGRTTSSATGLRSRSPLVRESVPARDAHGRQRGPVSTPGQYVDAVLMSSYDGLELGSANDGAGVSLDSEGNVAAPSSPRVHLRSSSKRPLLQPLRPASPPVAPSHKPYSQQARPSPPTQSQPSSNMDARFPPTPISRTRLAVVASAMAGIQICYSAQINHGSAALLSLGLDESKVSLAWLAGPLSGLIMQPIIGVASDGCTSPLGKRRPFLIAGAILTAVSLLMFANAPDVGKFLSPGDETAASRIALSVAIFCFFLLDFSIQAIQAPLRALMTDIATGDLMPVGNSYIALFTGCGNLFGSLLASRKLSAAFPMFETDTQALFFLAAVFLLTTVALACVSVQETQLQPNHGIDLDELDERTPLGPTSTSSLGHSRPLELEIGVVASASSLFEDPPHDQEASRGPFSRTFRGSRPRTAVNISPSPSMFSLSLMPSPSMESLRSPRPSRLAAPASTQDMRSLSLRPVGSRTSLRSAPSAPVHPAASAPVLAIPEQHHVESAPSQSTPQQENATAKRIYGLLYNAPRPFWRVFAVQLFTWFGFFSLFVFVNPWVGTNIYLGSGAAPVGSEKRELFEDGVRLGGVGNALTAIITVAYSPLLTSILERHGTLATYAFSQFVEAACLIGARFLRGTPGQGRPSFLLKCATVLDIGAFGIVWATTMGVPWSIIGKALYDDPEYRPRIGLFTTVFNASQSFPQLFVSFGSPFILRSFDNDVSMVMFVGGCLALVGMALVYLLRVDLFQDEEETPESDYEPNMSLPRNYSSSTNRDVPLSVGNATDTEPFTPQTTPLISPPAEQ